MQQQVFCIHVEEDQSWFILYAMPQEDVQSFHASGAAKRLLTRAIRDLLDKSEKTGVGAVVHITEAWMRTVRKEDEQLLQSLLDGKRKLADDPERKEVLLVTVHTLAEGSLHSSMPITITDDGKRHCEYMPLDRTLENLGGRLSL